MCGLAVEEVAPAGVNIAPIGIQVRPHDQIVSVSQ